MISATDFLNTLEQDFDGGEWSEKLAKLFLDFQKRIQDHKEAEPLEFNYNLDGIDDEISIEIWFHKEMKYSQITESLIQFIADSEVYFIYNRIDTYHDNVELIITNCESTSSVVDYIRDCWLCDLTEEELPSLIHEVYVDNTQYDEFDHGIKTGEVPF